MGTHLLRSAVIYLDVFEAEGGGEVMLGYVKCSLTFSVKCKAHFTTSIFVGIY